MVMPVNRRIIIALLKMGSVVLIWAVVFFSGNRSLVPSSLISLVLTEIEAFFRDTETQWMMFVCLAV